ncbi:hypothetical protein UCRPC4_g03024 [Phaeomoniella chlamydospora]|uniref:Uncharacterized protein n=1 Tax=Phaeomoniella chlamydospora TaxID=158046 RepID=A0A0G2GHD6_PHACM|nr:hypothetical protein UCRPC4_g03024 [Phaeomoniella chlamydospora]
MKEQKYGLEKSTLPASDEEIRRAIKSLEASTATIEQQIKFLKHQHASIASLSRENLSRSKNFASATRGLHQKWQYESQHTNIVTEELSSEVSATLKNLDEHVAASIRVVKPSVTAQLKGHDRQLSQLNEINLDIDEKDTEEKFSPERIKKLSSILAKLMEDEVRTRLDRIYLEESSSPPNGPNDQGAGADEEVDNAIRSLEESINPLRSEVFDVAAMYTHHVYRDPIFLSLEHSKQKASSQAASKQTQILSTLSNLTSDLDNTTDRLLEFHAFRTALENIKAAVTAVSTTQTTPRSPAKQHPASSHIATLSSYPSLLSLLQNLPVPGITPSTPLSSLPSLLTTQASKTQHSTKSAQSNLLSSLESHISESRSEVTLINEAVERDNLLRPRTDEDDVDGLNKENDESKQTGDLIGRVDGLGDKVGEIGRLVEGVSGKIEELGREGGGGGKKKEEFLRRWGGGDRGGR